MNHYVMGGYEWNCIGKCKLCGNKVYNPSTVMCGRPNCPEIIAYDLIKTKIEEKKNETIQYDLEETG